MSLYLDLHAIRCALKLHRTSIIEGESTGLVGCRDCGHVEQVWTLFRPEQIHRQSAEDVQAEYAAFWARNEPKATVLKWRTK